MSYLPRPDVDRTTQDVDEIYALAAEDLQRAKNASERRHAFRTALLRSFEAGVDAQRDLVRSYEHDRPTPIPFVPEKGILDDDTEPDPGTLPPIKVKSWKPPQ